MGTSDPRRAAQAAVLMAAALWLGALRATADDLVRVSLRTPEQGSLTVEGRILVTAVDGGLLLEDRGGRLWNVTPDRLDRTEAMGAAYARWTSEELGRQLQSEFGDRFEIVATPHYVICTSAGRRYGDWCGALFERLLHGFLNFWERDQLGLVAPGDPLPAIVFATQAEYARYATADAGPALAGGVGYYSARTNRIVLYDLTAQAGGAPARTTEEVSRKISQSPFNVATVVHEATHQIAFNCGLHTRYADNPMWLTEGLAMYFETPDLSNRSGWRTIGRVNTGRLTEFRRYQQGPRPADSLRTLTVNDERFRDPEAAPAAYAESWALCYFLIRTRRTAFADYLKTVSAKPRLEWDTPETRSAQFAAAFGDDAAALDRDFLRYLRNVRGAN